MSDLHKIQQELEKMRVGALANGAVSHAVTISQTKKKLSLQAEQITKLEERVRELEEVFSEFKIEKDADGKMVIQYWSGGGVVVENNKEDSIAGQVLYDLANHLLNKQQS